MIDKFDLFSDHMVVTFSTKTNKTKQTNKKGARASGTNDKSGSAINFMRWVSVRTVKESFLPLSDWRYPHMQKD